MKKILFFFFLSVMTINIYASSDSTKFEIHIIDYSLSWTSTVHYYLNDELRIEEVDNVDNKKVDVLAHRQLFAVEMDAIRQYLQIFMNIDLHSEYATQVPGVRNQKRVNITYGDKTKSVFVSNTYQQDIAGLISFLNELLPEPRKMKELIDPNKPAKR